MIPIREPFDPADLSQEGFLLGPNRDEEAEIIIDDIFGKSFERIYAEQKAYDPSSLEVVDDALWTTSQIDADFQFVDVEAGLLLIGPGRKACGGYIGCDVSLASEHQGQGLGAELILEYAMRNGGLPTWDLQSAAYSEDGYRAHLNAYSMALDRAFFERKRLAMTAPSGRPCLDPENRPDA